MRIARRVSKEANDNSKGIYSGAFREAGAWVVERRVTAIAPQETVPVARRVGIYPGNGIPNVTPASKGKAGARIIKGRVVPMD